jgi:preprotein translocase subunit Sec61beta
MDKPKVGPKDFFLWAGAMIALYASVFSLLALFFDYINVAFPDALNTYFDPYSTAIRIAIASLIVMFPVFLILMHFIRRDIARDHAKKNLWVRRWALVLTIFLAGLTVVIDLITLINTYLGGELTTHFILKVLIVFLVAGAGLLHFLADYWGYWDINPRYARTIAIAVSVLVIATVVSGFFIIGTPGEIRMYRFDDQKVSDLQNIQSEVVNYWQTEGALPATLGDLTDSISGFSVPVDEETNVPYTYATTSALSFKLCANFNAETQPNSQSSDAYSYAMPAGAGGQDLASDSWFHAAGRVCFARTIDPKRYPPITKPQ